MKTTKLQLYAITDRKWLGGKSLADQVEIALKSGVSILQLREKSLDYDQFLSEATEIKVICDKYNVPLIINDNVRIALQSDAAGVHVGLSDTSIGEARRMLGENKIIGASVHSVKEAVEAQAQGANYLGVGAMFGSTTKTDIRLTSIETLAEIVKNVDIPVYAIGGINIDNVRMLHGTGVAGVCAVSAIFGADDICRATGEFLNAISDF